jgi:hypothetical protein
MGDARRICERCRFALGPAPLPLVCANAGSPHGGERVAETDSCNLFQDGAPVDAMRAIDGVEG